MLSQDEHYIREKHGGERTEGFEVDLKRLHDGEPLAFILGTIPFLDTTIYLDTHPLIPRVETEYWVHEILKGVQASGVTSPKVLDLCAGSGCIGVAVAHAVKESIVHFAEVDATHHATIRKNIALNHIEEGRTAVFGGHLYENALPPYDLILCNPPYLPVGSPHVAESVKRFEPALALYGGERGLDLIIEVIRGARQRLKENGMLVVEHEPDQQEALAQMALEAGLTAETHNDQYGLARYTTFRVAQ